MLLKLVAIDVETGNFVFKEVAEGLPAGTIDQTLRHDGTDWVANDLVLMKSATNELQVGESKANMLIGRYIFRVQTQLAYQDFLLKAADLNAIIHGFLSGGTSTFKLRNQLTQLLLENTTSYTSQMVIIASVNSATKFGVYQDGKIFSNVLTANTYIGANANKEIVSIQSPNQIRYVPADRTSTDATVWQDAAIFLNVEANVVYELTLNLVFGNIAGRNGRLKIVSPNFIYKPIVTGNVNSVSDSAIIMRNTADVKPESLSVGEEYSFQLTGYQSSYIEMRGIFISTVPDPALRLEFKTDDDTMPLVLKAYSYLKLSR